MISFRTRNMRVLMRLKSFAIGRPLLEGFLSILAASQMEGSKRFPAFPGMIRTRATL